MPRPVVVWVDPEGPLAAVEGGLIAQGLAVEIAADAAALRRVAADATVVIAASQVDAAVLAEIARLTASGDRAVVIFSDHSNPARIAAALRAGAADYVLCSDPADAAELAERLAMLPPPGGTRGPVQQAVQLRQILRTLQHDVRNPVGNVLGYADLLRDGLPADGDPELRDFVARIEANCRRALAILDAARDAVTALDGEDPAS